MATSNLTDGTINSQDATLTALGSVARVTGSSDFNLTVVDRDDVSGVFGTGNINKVIITSGGEILSIQGGHVQPPQIARSSNGIDWTGSRPTGISANDSANGAALDIIETDTEEFVIVGGGNSITVDGVDYNRGARLFYSTDDLSTINSVDLDTILSNAGIDNSNRLDLNVPTLLSLATDGSKVIATGSHHMILIADVSDLTSWSVVSLPSWSPQISQKRWIETHVAYGGGRFVISAGGIGTAYSTNGTSWTVGEEANGVDAPMYGSSDYGVVRSIEYGDGQFLIGTDKGEIWTTSNGESVTKRADTEVIPKSHIKGGEYFSDLDIWIFATGSGLVAGYDGSTKWRYDPEGTIGLNTVPKDITFKGSTMVVVGSGAYIAYATASDSFSPTIGITSFPSLVESTAKVSRLPITATIGAQSTAVAGLGERTLNNDGNGQAVVSGSSSVTGSSRREIRNSVLLESGPPSITGPVIRESNALGTLESGASTVVGESERELDDDQNVQDISSGNSITTGAATRTIVSSGTLESGQSLINGLAENEIPAESGAARASLSTVSGTGDRESNSESGVLVSGDATLSNTAERIIPAEDIEITNGSSSVTATTGRTVTGSGEIQSEDSHAHGASENIITGFDADIQVGSAIVTGSADKVLVTSLAYSAPDITLSGVGTREKITSSNLVTSGITFAGSASRGHETLSTTLESGQSSTTGLAEVISKGSGVLETGASDVSGLSERTANASGDLTTGTVTVLGAASKGLPASGIGGSGSSFLGPNTAFYVSYNGDDIVVSGVPSNNSLNGSYDLVSGVNLVSSGGSTPQNYAANSSYGVWQKNNGDGTYDVLIYWTNQSLWVIYEETTPVTSVQAGDSFSDTSSTAVASGSVSIQIPGGSTTPSLVAGVAGRTIVEVEANLTADEIGFGAVTGEAENTIVEVDSTLNSDVSITTGNAVRHSIGVGSPASLESSVDATTQKIVKVDNATNSGSSTVAGLSERTSSGTGSLESSESFAMGITVSGSNLLDGIEQIGDATVSGSGFRTSNGINTDLTADEVGFGAVTGDGENIIVAGIALVESGPSSASGTGRKSQLGLDQNITNSSSASVSGVGEREVTLEQGITTGSSETYYGPDAADADVSYNGQDLVVSNQFLSDMNGTYTYTGVEKVVNGSTWTANSDYRVWEKDLGNGYYNVVAYQTSNSRWAIWIYQGASVSTAPSSTQLAPYELATSSDTISVSSGNSSFSTVSGSGTIGRNSSGQLIVTELSEVSGLSERVVVEIEANLTAAEIGFSVVTGDGENIIVNVDATVASGQSEVTAMSERTVEIKSGIKKVDNSVVSSVVEITSNLLSTDIVSSSSSVIGIAENTVVSQSADIKSQEANFVGLTEKTTISDGDTISEESTVIGSGFRTSNGINIDLTADEVGFGAVTGDGENIIVNVNADVASGVASSSGNGVRTSKVAGPEVFGPGSNVVYSRESIIDGVATRTVEDNLATHDLVASGVVLNGLAERKLPSEAVELSVSESSASGSGARHANVLEGDLTAAEIGLSGVAGTSEREVVEDCNLSSQNAEVVGQGVRHSNGTGAVASGASSASGLGERQVDVLGDMKSGPSIATGLSERTINSVPNYGTVGDLVAFGPDDNGPSLWYITDYKVLYDGTGEHYDVLNGDKSFTLKVSFNNLVVQETSNTVAKDYNIYWRDKSGVLGDPNRFDVIFFSTTAGRWYQEEFAIHPAEWYDGQVLESYIANNTVELTSIDAKRTGDASSRIYSSESFIAAVSENIIPVVKSDIVSQQSEVEGLGKIIRLPTSLDYKMPDVTVSGIGERTLNNDGLGQQLISGQSSLTGLSERTVNTLNAEITVTESQVVGVVERTLNNDGLGQQLVAGESTITATVKITTFLQSGVNNIEDSKVVGVGERTLNNKPFGQELVSGQSSVVGVAERQLNNDGLGQQLFTGQSIVIGLGERTVNLEQSASSESAEVIGLSERSVNLLTGISDHNGEVYKRPAISNSVHYVGANIAVTNLGTANGTYNKTDFRFVIANGETYSGADFTFSFYTDDPNHMSYEKDNGNGTFNVLLFKPISSTWEIWVGETVSVSDASVGTMLVDSSPVVVSTGTQDYSVDPGCTTPSIVTGVAERILNHDDNTQAVFSDRATVSGVAERTIVRLPDFLGPLGESPDSNDSNVSYVGTSLEVLNFLGGISFFNGIYEQVYYTGHFTESGTSDYVFHKDSHNTSHALHNWYVLPYPSFGGWFVALHNETKHEWYVTFSSTDPYNWEDGEVLVGLRGLQSLLATNSEERPTGFSAMKGTSSVVGASEREINPSAGLVSGNSETSGSGVRVSNVLNGDLKSGESSKTGVIERQIDPIDIHLTSGEVSLSFISAVGERKVIGVGAIRLHDSDAEVSGKAERTVVAAGTLVTVPSTVSGFAERQVDLEGPGPLITGPSLVSGSSERKVVGSGTLESQFTHLNETEGVAERKIVVIDGSIKSDAPTVIGVAKRVINTLPEPVSGEIRIYSGTNRPWQYAPRSATETKPRVSSNGIYQTVGFQEAIPIYQTILVRAPRKRTK